MPDTRISAYRTRLDQTHAGLGKQLGVGRQTAHRYCLPVSHPEHRRPGRRASDRLRELTYGLIHAGNYADEVTPAEAAEMMAEIARREAVAKAGEAANG